MNNVQMRWFAYYDKEGDYEKVLQYREYRDVSDYSRFDRSTGLPTVHKEWSEWITVPTVERK